MKFYLITQTDEDKKNRDYTMATYNSYEEALSAYDEYVNDDVYKNIVLENSDKVLKETRR